MTAHLLATARLQADEAARDASWLDIPFTRFRPTGFKG